MHAASCLATSNLMRIEAEAISQPAAPISLSQLASCIKPSLPQTIWRSAAKRL